MEGIDSANSQNEYKDKPADLKPKSIGKIKKLNRRKIIIIALIILIALVIIQALQRWMDKEGNQGFTANRPVVENNSFLGGTMPPLSEESFTEDPGAGNSCLVSPASSLLAPGSKAKFTVSLTRGKNNSPFRLALGDLPVGVTGKFSELKENKVELELVSETNAQRGSFNIVLGFQEMKDRKFFTENTVSRNICQFNLVIR